MLHAFASIPVAVAFCAAFVLIPVTNGIYQNRPVMFWIFWYGMQLCYAASTITAWIWQWTGCLPLPLIRTRIVCIAARIALFAAVGATIYFTGWYLLSPSVIRLCPPFVGFVGCTTCVLVGVIVSVYPDWKRQDAKSRPFASSLDAPLLLLNDHGSRVLVHAADNEIDEKLSLFKQPYSQLESDRRGDGYGNITLNSSPWIVVAWMLVIQVGKVGIYMLLEWFSQFALTQTNRFDLILQYVAFAGTIFCWRVLFKIVAREVDFCKQGGMPYYLFIDADADIYFWVFYRQLFQRVQPDSLYLFAILFVLHVIAEWLMFAMRETHWYFLLTNRLSDAVMARLPAILSKMRARLKQSSSSYEQWIALMSLGFGVRWYVMIGITACWLVQIVCQHYGPNVFFYPFYSSMPSVTFITTTVAVACAVAGETVNTFIMEKLFWARRNYSIRARMSALFYSPGFRTLVTIEMCGIMCNAAATRFQYTFS